MILFFVTVLFEYLLTAVLVGVTFFTIFGHKIKLPYTIKPALVLFGIFAFLDVFYLPALNSLNGTITIGNKQLVEILDMKGNIPLTELFRPGLFDVGVWGIQAGIAHYIGSRVYSESIRIRKLW